MKSLPTDTPHGVVEAKGTSHVLEPITSSCYVDSRVMLVIVEVLGAFSLSDNSLRSALRGLRLQVLRDSGQPGRMIKGPIGHYARIWFRSLESSNTCRSLVGIQIPNSIYVRKNDFSDRLHDLHLVSCPLEGSTIRYIRHVAPLPSSLRRHYPSLHFSCIFFNLHHSPLNMRMPEVVWESVCLSTPWPQDLRP